MKIRKTGGTYLLLTQKQHILLIISGLKRQLNENSNFLKEDKQKNSTFFRAFTKPKAIFIPSIIKISAAINFKSAAINSKSPPLVKSHLNQSLKNAPPRPFFSSRISHSVCHNFCKQLYQISAIEYVPHSHNLPTRP